MAALPPVLQSQAIQYAEQTEIPSELVIELAIAHFLDPDSVTFDDCQVTVEQTSVSWLKQYADVVGRQRLLSVKVSWRSHLD